ncbi:MAG: hypothetical protein UY04_C0013G0002 [Parcubacteria group bacterium GW2011_GWA2_47_7]|nr:MAG: hypothetical protein UY04_C0013G0002 [Parcubacteria group bacterium GW2011_GWA2_47_7]
MLTQRERKVATVGAVAAVEIENMFIVCKMLDLIWGM